MLGIDSELNADFVGIKSTLGYGLIEGHTGYQNDKSYYSIVDSNFEKSLYILSSKWEPDFEESQSSTEGITVCNHKLSA